MDWIDISAETTVDITVGAGGAGGTGSPPGGDGGESKFGDYVVSAGGDGGTRDAVTGASSTPAQAACGSVTFDARVTGMNLNVQAAPYSSTAERLQIGSTGSRGAGGREGVDYIHPAGEGLAGTDGFVTVRVVG